MSFEALFAEKIARIDRTHVVQPGRTALLVIDMQRGFLDPGAALEVSRAREIIPRVVQLVDACRGHAVPVIFTQYVYDPAVPCLRGDPFGPEHLQASAGEQRGYGRRSSNCLLGEPGINSPDIVDELKPRDDELVIQGCTYDKFYGTPLDLALRSRDIRCLLMTGIVAEVCVADTLTSASTREYRVTAVVDGISGLSAESEQACHTVWRNKYARLRTTTEVIDEINGLSISASSRAESRL